MSDCDAPQAEVEAIFGSLPLLAAGSDIELMRKSVHTLCVKTPVCVRDLKWSADPLKVVHTPNGEGRDEVGRFHLWESVTTAG